jgi:uncharacterized protein (TIGR02996 family)
MCAAPEEAAHRLVYADWLEERGDRRAELLREEWNVPRLSFLDWSWVQRDLKFYLDHHPELRSRLYEHEVNRQWRERVLALGDAVDPSWLAVVDTLGRPFHPFLFWNNAGQSFEAGQLPFREQIGTRGVVLTFARSFLGPGALEPGLVADLRFLRQLRFGACAYGAAICPTHPFLCELKTTRRPLTAADVIEALAVRDFRSQHIPTLDAAAIANPGYQPATYNDEIHNNPTEQYLFPHPGDEVEPEGEADDLAPRASTHDALREYVEGGQLWYVLLHSWTDLPHAVRERLGWVVLFAIGRSPHGNRLLGAVSHQQCHNLCD